MKRVHLIFNIAICVSMLLILFGCGSSPMTTKVLNADAFLSSKSITINDFSAKDATLNYDGNADSLGHVMAALIQKEIKQIKNPVETFLGKSDSITTDMVVEGKFTLIDAGSGAARILIGTGGATVSVKGVVKDKSGTVIAEFSKSKTSSGGPLGMGGLLAGSGTKIIGDNMEDIAKDVAKFIMKQINNK